MTVLCQHLCYCTAKSAINIMILSSQDRPCFPGAADHQLLIQRFDGKHIYHTHLDIFFCQILSCFQCITNFNAAGDHCSICTIPYNISFANLKFFCAGIVNGLSFSWEAQIHHTIGICHFLQDLLEEIWLVNIHNGHPGKRSVDPHILKGHMGTTVGFCGDPRV